MINNKDLLAFFYQEQNLRKLEELIDESLQTLGSCKEAQSVDEWELFCINNRAVTTNEEANKLLDELVYPRIQDMIEDTDIKKPKIIMQGNGFFKDILNLQRDSWKYLVLGGVTIFPISLAFGANISEAVMMTAMFPIAHTVKGILQYRGAGGWVDPTSNTIAYVKSDSISHFIYAMSHEVVHCIQGQKTNPLLTLVQAYTGRYSLYVEGSAELITQKVMAEIDGDEWDDAKNRHATSRAYQRLLNSYHELCDKLQIGEDKKRFKKNADIPTDVYNCSMHDMGYSVMKLLTQNKDKRAYIDILLNRFDP